MNELLSARNGHPVEVIVPEHYLNIEAWAWRYYPATAGDSVFDPLPEDVAIPALLRTAETCRMSSCRATALNQRIDEAGPGYLGVDVGSTSTKAVIMDGPGSTSWPRTT